MMNNRAVWQGVGILILTAILLYGSYYLNDWRGRFWEDISKKDTHQLLSLIIQFSIAAFICVYSSAAQTWLQSKLSLSLRDTLAKWITIKYLGSSKNLANLNPDQRIAEDCRLITVNAVNLVSGGIMNLAKAGIFIYVLYSFSGQFFSTPYTLPLATVVYTVLSVLLVFWVGQMCQLVSLVSEAQSNEANYRTGLIKLEDNEHGGRFSIMALQYQILFMRQKILNIFIGTYDQFSVIAPLLFLIPVYMIQPTFTFGVLMQVLNAVGELVLSLSFLTNNWSTVLETRTCANRLKKLLNALTDDNIETIVKS
jgi:ABC-type uncharacterized transport system fused permease/ATPase subunit